MKLLTGYLSPSEGHARVAGYDMGHDRIAGISLLGLPSRKRTALS